MNLLYLGCHVIYCPNSKHFKSWWESYYMYSVTKSTKWAVKDKSGYMSTLVMLIRTIFQGKWPLLQRGWRGCPSWWGGKTLILNGRPERWEQQSMILSLSVAWLYHLHAEGTHIHIWGAGTFLWSTPGEATSWGLWAEVLSPASQLTNPQHCSEGLSCEPWEESFLNQGLQRGWKEGGAIMLPLSNATRLRHCVQLVPASLGGKLKAKFSWQGLSIQTTTYIIIIFAGKMKTWRPSDITRSARRESLGDVWVPVLGPSQHITLLHGNTPGRWHCLHLICRYA